MMKVLSILLAFQIFLAGLLPNMDTHDLDSIPELIEHFKEHQEKAKGSISFLTFLKLHYNENDHTRQNDHSNLPFKHQHSCNTVSVALLQAFSFSFFALEQNESKVVLNDNLVSFYAASFWQPPKLA